MVSIDAIERVLDKLSAPKENGIEVPGEIVYPTGAKHQRIEYRLCGTAVFSFGLTRSSSRRSKSFWYVPNRMHLSNREFDDLRLCPMTKADYNQIAEQYISPSARGEQPPSCAGPGHVRLC